MGLCGSSDNDAYMNPECVDLSHFMVGNCIGKGGFGKVHAVLHKGTGMQMAMKRLEKSKIVGKTWHSNAVWVERNLLELLQTPYTNRLFFAFQSKWELFLVMPFYRGGDLKWYLNKKRKPLKTSVIQYYAAELLLGLSELRRLKVVYRDLKPENILFNDTGHVCITDFGICGQLTPENGFKLSDRFGTTRYMSPNQYKGKPYDFCCDYFAFGLVLFEMATAKVLHQTSKRVIEDETDEWYQSKMGAITSMPLKDLILSLLTVDREQRLGVASVTEIFDHKFFHGIDWKAFGEGTQQHPPHIPNVKSLNCSMEQMALDAISEDDPTHSKPPKPEQQKVFDEFNFNTENKKNWMEHWSKIYSMKNPDRYTQILWDKQVDTNEFDQPKSQLPSLFESIHIEIRKSMSAQVRKSQTKLIDLDSLPEPLMADLKEE